MKLTGKIPRLESLYAKARTEAVARGEPVLMSWSEVVPVLDPLAWLASIVQAAEDDPSIASLVSEGCAYWSRPAEGFAFSGVGAAIALTPDGQGRFRSADLQWSKLLDGLVTDGVDEDGPSNQIDNFARPILTGGFAFDSHGATSTEWQDFSSAHLIVPSLLLATAGTASRITFSVMIDSLEDEATLGTLSRLRLMALAPVDDSGRQAEHGRPAMVSYSSELPVSAWRELVSDAVDEINRGRFEKVVLARAVRASADGDLDPFALLRHLTIENTEAFVFGFWRGSNVFLGASPERLVRLDGRLVRASSLAGTARRYRDTAKDEATVAELFASAKERAEHALVRDALERVLEEVCADIDAPAEPEVLSLSQVHHLHTAVRGQLRPGHSLLDVVERLHPTPAVGGSPRGAALAFIDEREGLDRGWYSGPVGWVGLHGGEFAVALRAGLVAGSSALLFAGCGIVTGSDPALELAESMLKLKPMQSALEAGTVQKTPPSGAQNLVGRT